MNTTQHNHLDTPNNYITAASKSLATPLELGSMAAAHDPVPVEDFE